MKVIVAGSRSFNNYGLLEKKLNKILSRCIASAEIVSGGAKGADTMGERYAKAHKLSVHRFPAQWEKYGRSAGYKRNAEMAEFADALVAFWDGASRGTEHMINLAREKGLRVRVVNY